MMKVLILTCMLWVQCICIQAQTKNNISIIPRPSRIEFKKGNFELNPATVWVLNKEELKLVQQFFSAKIEQSTGFKNTIAAKLPKSNYISLEINAKAAPNKEAYELHVTAKGVHIKAKTSHGIFYGLQTLFQLLPPQIENNTITEIKWLVPCINIKDEPRFEWRGLMIDVCRHFVPVATIKKQLDMLAMFKMNKFHWHLTDDQGWRIEIKKYPELTALGSKRIEADGSIHQGYYTQEEIKEVVAYAKTRYIDVVPEIEFPGHALAALTAYPELSCTGGPFTPRIVWGVETDVFCAGNEEVFSFLENVFKELVPMFPYEYYHIGGDECPKDRWDNCPKCKKRMETEHIKNTHEMQAYFVVRMEKVLAGLGKKMIGWDEILEGEIPQNTAIMSWRGEEGGIAAANKGHDVVMSPGKFLYIDKYQGDPKVEPITIGGNLTCKKIYEYDPVPAQIEASKTKHIKGSQGNYWGEYLYDIDKLEYMIYPRLLAIAEMNWTAKKLKNYKDFERRLQQQYVRMDAHRINYYIPQPEGAGKQVAFLDSVVLSFSTTLPVAKIVYTTNGKIPTENDQQYTKPLVFNKSVQLKIASVLPNHKMSVVREISVEKQSLQPAVAGSSFSKGLICKKTFGKFRSVDEIIPITKWDESVIDSIAQANTTWKWGFWVDSAKFGATVMTGYLEVPENGVYFFSSDQDQVWIDDQLIINNDKLPKRFSRNDGSIALAAGKHKLKIVYLNNIVDGWASDWNKLALAYRTSKENVYRKVEAGMLWR